MCAFVQAASISAVKDSQAVVCCGDDMFLGAVNSTSQEAGWGC